MSLSLIFLNLTLVFKLNFARSNVKMLNFLLKTVLIAFLYPKTYVISIKEPIDLGHPFDGNTLYWNTEERFVHRVNVSYSAPYWYSSGSFTSQEHGGTHLDAPYHFYEKGWTVDSITLDRLISRGVMIDVRGYVENNASFELRAQHLDNWIAQNGKLEYGTILLINFGWGLSRYHDRKAYFGSATPPYHFPGISMEAAKWIVNNGNIYGVGVDTPSLDPGSSKYFETHRILAENNLYGIENVAFGHHELPSRGFGLVVQPMNIVNGTGAPCRIFAFPTECGRANGTCFIGF